MKHGLFILEALEYQVALLILELPYLVIGSHIIVFKASTACVGEILPAEAPIALTRMEHMSAEIQDSAFVYFSVFVRPVWACDCRLLRVVFHER